MTVTLGDMGRAVAAALKAAGPPPADAAAVALVKRYAALIDEATPRSVYAEHLRGLRAAVSGNEAAAKHLQRVEDALGAHSVASDLGPKLLAALTALGLTAAGRGGVKGGPGVSAVAGKLDELRARRDRRRGVGSD
ncbi:MAG TPA: hypothetical protein VFC00_00445 [Micromonosporaceae bacterium]|nr:hypothetical protein [Micromonosporaceae bacterium]